MDNPVDIEELRDLLGGPEVFCTGRCSSVCKHPTEDVAVSVHDSTIDWDLYCRVGICNNGVRVWRPPVRYDKGALPSVAVIHFDGNFYVLETHVASDSVRRLFLNIGKLDMEAKEIDWQKITGPNKIEWCRGPTANSGAAFERFTNDSRKGKKPKICANDQGVVIIVYERSFKFNQICYHCGQFQVINGKPHIDWMKQSRVLNGVRGVEPDVALSNNTIALIYRAGFLCTIKSSIGTVKNYAITLNNGQELLCKGRCPSISINTDGFMFACSQSAGGRWLYRCCGHIHSPHMWGAAVTQTYGEYPTVALDDNGVLIEIHKTNFGKSLYKSEGELQGMNPHQGARNGEQEPVRAANHLPHPAADIPVDVEAIELQPVHAADHPAADLPVDGEGGEQEPHAADRPAAGVPVDGERGGPEAVDGERGDDEGGEIEPERAAENDDEPVQLQGNRDENNHH